ncbi:condensation domain-containing protein, partial [Nostoc sp. CCY 9925]|uniref:condensation domain-containing protein n=1 Tax=Nostoc sp. CCY 9925 TaxID=3103865 RepID=UPI0039C6004E
MAIKIRYKGFDLEFENFPTPQQIQTAYELLQFKIKNILEKNNYSAIQPKSQDGECPLSFSQQRLWFLNQLELGSPLYNIHVAVRLMGLLNVLSLEHSLKQIVHRHKILQTSFMTAEGRQGVQVLASTVLISLQLLDLSHFSEVEREAETMRLASEEAQ